MLHYTTADVYMMQNMLNKVSVTRRNFQRNSFILLFCWGGCGGAGFEIAASAVILL